MRLSFAGGQELQPWDWKSSIRIGDWSDGEVGGCVRIFGLFELAMPVSVVSAWPSMPSGWRSGSGVVERLDGRKDLKMDFISFVRECAIAMGRGQRSQGECGVLKLQATWCMALAELCRRGVQCTSVQSESKMKR